MFEREAKMLFFLVFVLLFDSIRLSTVQTQLSASRDAAVRPEFFEERARWRERERSYQMPLGGNSLDLGTWQR